MHAYELSQWILFFFLYSFFGWIWESCYVSVKKQRWVNRGFMHGPVLPLYGSGAVVILVSTIGVRENPALVFIMGMAGATVLEYFTGAAMEKLFHVRYWDYSNIKFNVNGYICLAASFCWGCFSLLLVRVIHIPAERFVLQIPDRAADIIAFVFTAAAAVDFTQSFNEAMDMKRILLQLEESRKQIRTMQDKLKVSTAEMRREIKEHSEEWEARRRSRRERYLDRIHDLRQERQEQLGRMYEQAEQLIHGSFPGKLPFEDLEALKRAIRREFEKMGERTDQKYLRTVRLLRRNPTAVSNRFKGALEELRKLYDEKKG